MIPLNWMRAEEWCASDKLLAALFREHGDDPGRQQHDLTSLIAAFGEITANRVIVGAIS